MAIQSMLFNQSATWVHISPATLEESAEKRHSLSNIRVDVSSRRESLSSQGAQTANSARLFYLATSSKLDGDTGIPVFADGDSIIFDRVEYRIAGFRRVYGANRLNHIEVELV